MKSFKISKRYVFLFVYFFYTIQKTLGTTQFSLLSGWTYINSLTNYSVIIVLALLLYDRKIKRIWMTIIFILMTVGIIIAFFNDNYIITITVILFIINGRILGEKEREILLRNYVLISSIILIVTILLTFIGVFYADYRIGARGTVRQYLGFLHATDSPNCLFHIVLAFVAQKRKRIGLIETIIILMANYWIYTLTDTKAVFYYINAIVIILWLMKSMPRLIKTKFATFIAFSIMPIGAISSLLLAIFYNPSNRILFALNTMLSRRLALGYQAINQYGLSLFGTEVSWQTGRYGIERFEEYLYVDSAFVNIAINYGLIILIILVLGFALMTLKAQKQKEYYLTVSLAFLGIHSFSDPQLLEPRYNPFLLFLFGTFTYFLRQRKDKQKLEFQVRIR